MPRPPAGSVTGPSPLRLTVSVPAAPPPWPTTLIATVAMPWAAIDAPTTYGLLCIESPKPWPKRATGHPCAGRVPAGRTSVKTRSFVPCTTGRPERVPVGGMKRPAAS